MRVINANSLERSLLLRIGTATYIRTLKAWPEPHTSAVPFGLSGGEHEAGTDHMRAATIPKTVGANSGTDTDIDSELTHVPVGADPLCKTGISADYHNHGIVTCCAKECGVCTVFEFERNVSLVDCIGSHDVVLLGITM
jgi:hypothetical protein